MASKWFTVAVNSLESTLAFIWLRAANCSSDEIENLLRTALPIIQAFIEENEESCLVLGVCAKT